MGMFGDIGDMKESEGEGRERERERESELNNQWAGSNRQDEMPAEAASVVQGKRAMAKHDGACQIRK